MDTAERNKIMRSMMAKAIVADTGSLSIIPQMDLTHNLEQLALWKLKIEKQKEEVRHSRTEIKQLEAKLRKRGLIK